MLINDKTRKLIVVVHKSPDYTQIDRKLQKSSIESLYHVLYHALVN